MVFILFLFLCLCSCNNNPLPSSSFLKVERSVQPKNCYKNCSKNSRLFATASSFVIGHSKKKTYLMTAGHVCNPAPVKIGVELKEKFQVTSIDGFKYDVNIKRTNNLYDLCILESKRIKYPKIDISNMPPTPSQKVVNISSPRGIASKNLLMYYDGRFGGEREGFAVYSLGASAGSSGSPILSLDNKVVGVVSSVHRDFHHIVISPTTHQIFLFSGKYKND